MKNREQILEPFRIVIPDLANMASKTYVKYYDALVAMQDYSDQETAELKERLEWAKAESLKWFNEAEAIKRYAAEAEGKLNAARDEGKEPEVVRFGQGDLLMIQARDKDTSNRYLFLSPDEGKGRKVGDLAHELANVPIGEMPPAQVVLSFENPDCINALIHSLVELQAKFFRPQEDPPAPVQPVKEVDEKAVDDFLDQLPGTNYTRPTPPHRFKVGDEVKLIGDKSNHGLPINSLGDIKRLESWNDEPAYLVGLDMEVYAYWIYESDLELYGEKHTAPAASDKEQDWKEEAKSLCMAGCKSFTGGEKKHHKDCPNYPDSFSNLYDVLKSRYDSQSIQIERLSKAVTELTGLYNSVRHLNTVG